MSRRLRQQKRKFASVAIAMAIAGIASAGEESLLKNRDADHPGIITCCRPDELSKPEGQRHCLERLTAGDGADEAKSACAAVVGMEVAQAPNVQSTCQDNSGGNWLGIRTDQMRDRGWYQNDASNVVQAPALFPATSIAAGSAGCSSLAGFDVTASEWRSRQQQCSAQGGYESVHLYVSLSHEEASDQMAAAVSAEDPWWKDPRYRKRVYLVRTENRHELQKAVLDLMMSCKVVSYAFVSSHGSSGLVRWGKENSRVGESVGSFLDSALSPCALAPGARVQFEGCAIACGRGAEAVRQGLEHVFGNESYRSTPDGSAKSDPFEGVEIYANTARETSFIPHGFLHSIGFRPHTSSDNDLGLVYQRKAGAFATDIPTDKVAACQNHGWALSDARFNNIRSGD